MALNLVVRVRTFWNRLDHSTVIRYSTVQAVNLPDAHAIAKQLSEPASHDIHRECRVCAIMFMHPGRLVIPLDDIPDLQRSLDELQRSISEETDMLLPRRAIKV